MRRGVRIALICLLWPAAAFGQQVIETAGSRALGMGGAFVGVADDPTAVYWNPAGLASGPAAGITIGWADFRTGDRTGAPAPGPGQRTSKFVSLGTLPGRIIVRALSRKCAHALFECAAARQDLLCLTYGVTFLQTVTQGLVIGSTVKYERGAVISGPVGGQTTKDALTAAGDRGGPQQGSSTQISG